MSSFQKCQQFLTGGECLRPLDYLVRDVASFKLMSQAVQAMFQQALGIESKLRTVVESVWFDDVANGNYDLAIGAVVSTLLDPSDYFNAWYGKDGPQNYSQWDNKEFQTLAAQIDTEIDPAKRRSYSEIKVVNQRGELVGVARHILAWVKDQS